MIKKLLGLLGVMALMVGVVLVSGESAAHADGHSAERSFGATHVEPGGQITVTVNMTYTGVARLVETLPGGFTYVRNEGPADYVNVVGQEVEFIFLGQQSVSYVVQAPAQPGVYIFGGSLYDTAKAMVSVAGETQLAVGIDPTPTFRTSEDQSHARRSIGEDAPAWTPIGDPVSATAPSTLIYVLGGEDAPNFDINPQTGQMFTKLPLDYETQAMHVVTVTAIDPQGLMATLEVSITVNDVFEEPTLEPTMEPDAGEDVPPTPLPADAVPTVEVVPTAEVIATALPAEAVPAEPTPVPADAAQTLAPTAIPAPPVTATPTPEEDSGGGFPWVIVIIVVLLIIVIGGGGFWFLKSKMAG